jgi:hypothetical protein
VDRSNVLGSLTGSLAGLGVAFAELNTRRAMTFVHRLQRVVGKAWAFVGPRVRCVLSSAGVLVVAGLYAGLWGLFALVLGHLLWTYAVLPLAPHWNPHAARQFEVALLAALILFSSVPAAAMLSWVLYFQPQRRWFGLSPRATQRKTPPA